MTRTQLFLIGLIVFVALVVLIGGAALIVDATPTHPYTASMLVCGGALQLAGNHIARFASVDDARRWADEQLATGAYNLAYIHYSESALLYSTLLLVRDAGNCYDGQFREWAAPSAR